MLVEINLLPKKEPRNFATILIAIVGFILLLIGFVYLYWQITTLNDDISKVSNEKNLAAELLAIEQGKLANIESVNEVEQLTEAVAWTIEQRNDYKYIINEITKKLPERGFVQNFSLNDNTLNLTTQFDTSSEAAYYLSTLLKTDWIDEAVLTGRNSRPLITTDEDGETDAENELMPRYIANYTITLNLLKIKEETGIIPPSETADGKDGGDNNDN